MNYLKERQNKIVNLMMNNKSDAFITSSINWIQYFTGCFLDKSNPAVLIVKKNGDCELISPEGTIAGGTDIFEYCSYSVEELQKPIDNVCKILQNRLVSLGTKLSIYLQDCPAWLFITMKQSNKEIEDLSFELQKMAMIKDCIEIEDIKSTLRLNSRAYDNVKGNFKAGMSEIDLYGYVTGAFNNQAGTPIECICDLLSGERTLEIGGKPTNRIINKNECVIIDILPIRNGYYSDTTRTFFTGTPQMSQYQAYQTLLKAMAHGEAGLRPGNSADSVYFSVNKTIEDNGYKGLFPHHAGHGIGMNSFEAPYFIKKCDIKLVPGMIVTIEPGIYLTGEFGIRIENNYLITEDGFSLLFNYPKNIEYFII